MDVTYIFIILSAFFILAMMYFFIKRPENMNRLEVSIFCLLGFFNYVLLALFCFSREEFLVAIFALASLIFLFVGIFLVVEKKLLPEIWPICSICFLGTAVYATLSFLTTLS